MELSKQRTGVILNNTLIGEHARANAMRLRWSIVAETLRAAPRANTGFSPATLTRSASEGLAYPYPRFRFGLVSALCHQISGAREKSGPRGLPTETVERLTHATERHYQSVFAPTSEETLTGGPPAR